MQEIILSDKNMEKTVINSANKMRCAAGFFSIMIVVCLYLPIFGQAATPVHDVAVTAVSSPSWVVVDSTLSISVQVANKGEKVEEIRVFLIDSATDDTIEQWFPVIAPQNEDSTELFWNTKGVQPGRHSLKTVAVIANDENPANNVLYQSVTVVPDIHDIAVVRIEPSRKAVVAGDTISVLVGLKNNGAFSETAAVKFVLEGNGPAQNKTIILDPASDSSIIFVAKILASLAGSYTARAEASPVPHETVLENNVRWTMLTVLTQSAITVSSFELSLAKRKSGPDVFTRSQAVLVFTTEKGPLAGATIWGVWNGAVTMISGKTDAKGRVVMTSPELKNAVSGSQFTFTIGRVVPADGSIGRLLLGPTAKSILVP